MKELTINIPVTPAVLVDLDRGAACEFKYHSQDALVRVFLMPLPPDGEEVPENGLKSTLEFPYEGERESTPDLDFGGAS